MSERAAFWSAVVALLLALVMIVASVFVHGPAKADSGAPASFWRPSDGWQTEHTRNTRKVSKIIFAQNAKHAKHAHRRQPTRVKAWRVRVPELPPGCISTIDVVGDRRLGTEAAQDQALQQLRAEAVFRFGEMYADDKHLQRVAYQCVTTTVNNSLTGAIDKARQMVGGESGLLHRCRISAVICRAPMEAAR
jgi:hypothetical protein